MERFKNGSSNMAKEEIKRHNVWLPVVSKLERQNAVDNLEAILKITDAVMITAEANEEHVLTAINAGVTNYIVKPFAPDVLVKKMREAAEQVGRFKPPRAGRR